MDAKAVFLEAEWRHLVMANFAVDPDLLRPFVPQGAELDLWSGAAFASLVGFRFCRTRVKGVAIPFHRDFEEINLRFYVRRCEAGTWKRGVTFIKEIVPKPAIAWVARALYREPYVALPTRHTLREEPGELDVRYEWKTGDRWHVLGASCKGEPQLPKGGSEAQFIAEHYWGYSVQRDGGTVEYEVMHPPWRVWNAHSVVVDVDIGCVYGPDFVQALAAQPISAFIAEGSAVSVARGVRIRT